MSVFNAYMALSGAVDAELSKNESLSHRTTYHIGGPAALFATVHSYPALLRILSVLQREGVAWVILGRGSHILAADAGYDGCVIKLGREFSRIECSNEAVITAGAGAQLSKVVNETLSHALGGLEFCAGIPGSVGGAVSMNAGSRHHWIGQKLSSLVTLKPGEGLRRYEGSEIEWGYRWCSLPSDEIILEASFLLESSSKELIAQKMEKRLLYRRSHQPMGLPSCGSVFKNPPDKDAARLIEACGLKGYSVGGAQVSKQHANFIVNCGNASAEDVLNIIKHIHQSVHNEFGIDLSPELKFLGLR